MKKSLLFILFISFLIPLKASILDKRLINAAKNNNVKIVKELIEKGADVNAIDYEGRRALGWASGAGHLETVKILLENGADINAKSNDGWNALISASWHGNLEIVKYLIDHGADINATNKFGDSALIWASRNGHLEVVKILIENGADVSIKGLYGMTALDWASEREHFDVVKYLKRKNTEIVKDSLNITANNQDKKPDNINVTIKIQHDILLPDGNPGYKIFILGMIPNSKIFITVIDEKGNTIELIPENNPIYADNNGDYILVVSYGAKGITSGKYIFLITIGGISVHYLEVKMPIVNK